MNKLPTIKVKNKDYVQVKDRVIFFNETYLKGSIQTQVQEMAGGISIKAIIYPDASDEKRFFTGRSFGILKGNDKALEKLESVAVGRALAFMGIGVIEGIASADEMQDFYNKPNKPTDNEWNNRAT